MSPILQFVFALSLIIATAKIAGYLSTLLGQPAVLGELLAGLLLGPTVIDLLHSPVCNDPHLGQAFRDLAELGALFLMFVAGLEADFEGMQRVKRPAMFVGVLGVAFPVLMGALLLLPAGFKIEKSLFIGLILAATSVSISAQTLMELKVLRTRVGTTLLSAAVVDDVLVILLVSLFTALTTGSGSGIIAIALVAVRVVAYVVVAALFGLYVVPRLTALVDRLPISQGVLALTIVVALLYAVAAEVLGGMAAITGAFLAGLVFSRTAWRRQIDTGMKTMAYAWLVPVFFVSIGLETNARSLGLDGVPFALLIIAIAMASKLLGCGLGARLSGFSNGEALRLGIGMSSRGEVGLIVASLGLGNDLIDQGVFTSVVLMVLVTTLLTPIALRALYPRADHKESQT